MSNCSLLRSAAGYREAVRDVREGERARAIGREDGRVDE